MINLFRIILILTIIYYLMVSAIDLFRTLITQSNPWKVYQKTAAVKFFKK